jgi:hypothetical protein
MRNFAERLIAYETGGTECSETQALFQVCEKLRPVLVTLMGTGGFRALLSRALALANGEVHWLRAVEVRKDGSVDGAEVLEAKLGQEELFEGRVVLVGQLLGLLVAFIGENLTLRLVRETWPKVSLNDLDFEQGTKYEKRK